MAIFEHLPATGGFKGHPSAVGARYATAFDSSPNLKGPSRVPASVMSIKIHQIGALERINLTARREGKRRNWEAPVFREHPAELSVILDNQISGRKKLKTTLSDNTRLAPFWVPLGKRLAIAYV